MLLDDGWRLVLLVFHHDGEDSHDLFGFVGDGIHFGHVERESLRLFLRNPPRDRLAWLTAFRPPGFVASSGDGQTCSIKSASVCGGSSKALNTRSNARNSLFVMT